MAAAWDYYDHSVFIEVESTAVYNDADEANKKCKEICESIKGVHDVWNTLRIGWFGDAANEAAKFEEDWVRACTTLFGSGDPGVPTGAIFKVTGSAMIAGDNFGFCEDNIVRMFQDMEEALTSGGSSEPSGDREFRMPPIAEITPVE